jgi:hypothetical protein
MPNCGLPLRSAERLGLSGDARSTLLLRLSLNKKTQKRT